MRVPLTPRQLNAFLQVAELKNFRLAAEVLHLSQPALSRTINQMEHVLGAQLFDRTTRHVALTPAGVQLMPIARRIVREFDDAFSELNQFIQGRSGRITVAMLPSVGATLLPAAIASFKSGFPDVDFHLRGLSAGPLLDALDEGSADVGVSVRPPVNTLFEYDHLLEDDFVLVCRQDSPLARQAQASWRAFQDHPVIAPSSSSSIRPMADAAFLRLGLTIRPAFECDGELSTCGALIAQGLGIMPVPRLALCLMDLSRLAAVPLKKPILRRQIGIIVKAERSLSQAALHFVDHLAASCRGLPPPTSRTP